MKLFINTLLSPDGSISTEFSTERPYHHSVFFKLPKGLDGEKDIDLLNGTFVHTNVQPEGTYVLVHRSMKL